MERVGILTSGGDCQGLNSAIRGLAKGLYHHYGKKVEIYGIIDGYRGLINGEYRLMQPEDFSGIRFYSEFRPRNSRLIECNISFSGNLAVIFQNARFAQIPPVFRTFRRQCKSEIQAADDVFFFYPLRI